MRLHTINNYQAARQAQFVLAENAAGSLYAHVDTRGIATIGIGINLRAHGYLVLQALGFDVKGQTLSGAALAAEQSYIDEFYVAFQRDYLPGTTTSNAGFTTFNEILSRLANDAAYVGLDPPFFRVSLFALSPGDDVALFNALADTGYSIPRPAALVQPPAPVSQAATAYEAQLDSWLNTKVGGVSAVDVTSTLANHDSSERIALLSMLYNNPTTLPGDSLRNALIANDRAEAWFEIRYRSNPYTRNGNVISLAEREGLANRRYGEADLFGLFNDTPVEADYVAAYRMYTRHNNDTLHGGQAVGLQRYEILFAPGERGSEALPNELEPARDWLGSQYEVPLVAWDHIFVGGNGVGTGDVDLVFGEAGSDWLFAGAGNDVLVGGAGDDSLWGGTGNDRYVFKAGDGVDEIVDTDGADRIRLMSAGMLDGAGATRAGGSEMFERWVGAVAGTTVTYTLVHKGVDGQGNPLTDLWIEGGGLASGDRIIIKDYSPTRKFGITLDPSAAVALVPGTMVADVWLTPGYTPTTPSVSLPENGSLELGFAANRPARVGDRARFEVSGPGVPPLGILTGAETLLFVNGVREIDLAPGQSLKNLALLSLGDSDTNQSFTLTATLIDAQGAPISASATMIVEFQAVVEDAGVPPLEGEAEQAEESYSGDLYGTAANDHLTGYNDPEFVDSVQGVGGADWIRGREGRDMLFGYVFSADGPHINGPQSVDGADLIEGGADGDMIYGGRWRRSHLR